MMRDDDTKLCSKAEGVKIKRGRRFWRKLLKREGLEGSQSST